MATLLGTRRRKIDAGMLPCDPPEKMVGGPSDGGLCTACGAPIAPTEIALTFLDQDGADAALPPRVSSAVGDGTPPPRVADPSLMLLWGHSERSGLTRSGVMAQDSVIVVSQLFRRVGRQLRQPMWWVPLMGAYVAYYRHRRTSRRATEPGVNDVTAVAELIRRKLDAGLLPREPPKSLQAGRGDGSPCSACGRPIRREDHEWSFWANGVLTHRFHVTCHRLWEAECRTRGWHGGRPRRGPRDRDG